jgi:hypothetical protein
MTNLPKNAGLPDRFMSLLIGVPAAVLSAAFLLFLLEAGASSLVV